MSGRSGDDDTRVSLPLFCTVSGTPDSSVSSGNVKEKSYLATVGCPVVSE